MNVMAKIHIPEVHPDVLFEQAKVKFLQGKIKKLEEELAISKSSALSSEILWFSYRNQWIQKGEVNDHFLNDGDLSQNFPLIDGKQFKELLIKEGWKFSSGCWSHPDFPYDHYLTDNDYALHIRSCGTKVFCFRVEQTLKLPTK